MQSTRNCRTLSLFRPTNLKTLNSSTNSPWCGSRTVQVFSSTEKTPISFASRFCSQATEEKIMNRKVYDKLPEGNNYTAIAFVAGIIGTGIAFKIYDSQTPAKIKSYSVETPSKMLKAIRMRDYRTLEKLLKHGTYTPENMNETFELACRENDIISIRYLVSHKMSLDESHLKIALTHSDVPLILEILNNVKPINLETLKAATKLKDTQHQTKEEIFDLFEKKCRWIIDEEVLQALINENYKSIEKYYIEWKKSKSWSSSLQNFLIKNIQANNKEVVRLIIRHGVNINQEVMDIAASVDSKIYEFLRTVAPSLSVSEEAFYKAKDRKQAEHIMKSIRIDKISLFKIFNNPFQAFMLMKVALENGANLHVTDEKDNTLLHYAFSQGSSIEFIEYLTKMGVNRKAENKDGKMPYEMVGRKV